MANLLSSGFTKVAQNKRYIFWFWVLNLTLAEFGTAAFRRGAHAILDRSLYADRLVESFDLGVLIELISKPEFGTLKSMAYPSLYFGFMFFLTTSVVLPGIFTGYASTYRLPREEFFRACGRNLWRFIRILITAGVIMGVLAALLFAANDAIAKKAEESTNEKLPFELQVIGLAVIFLTMATLRVWFDLAEVDTVLNDQRAVRKAIAEAFRHTLRSLVRLLASYVVVTIIAAVVLLAGLWIWMKFVAPENVFGAFVVAQITLLLLLVPRFWQRGIAVSYWQERMLIPFAANVITKPVPVPVGAPVELPTPEAPPPLSTLPIEPPPS
ncbi:MAG TPA: hypothetical protein VMS18_19995 [Candidatus Binatia bacterium]|nr:hypothetical protein [Candidatus Binatia bacterium]